MTYLHLFKWINMALQLSNDVFDECFYHLDRFLWLFENGEIFDFWRFFWLSGVSASQTPPPKTRFLVDFEHVFMKSDSHDLLAPFKIDKYGTSAFQHRIWRMFLSSRTISLTMWKWLKFVDFGPFWADLPPPPKRPFLRPFFSFSFSFSVRWLTP